MSLTSLVVETHNLSVPAYMAWTNAANKEEPPLRCVLSSSPLRADLQAFRSIGYCGFESRCPIFLRGPNHSRITDTLKKRLADKRIPASESQDASL